MKSSKKSLIKSQKMILVKALDYNLHGELCLYGKPLVKIVKQPTVRARHKPLVKSYYVYSRLALQERVRLFQKRVTSSVQSKVHIHYAMKANSNLDVLRILQREKIGIDVVSLGELQRARQVGFAAKNILFSGVGKTEFELQESIRLKVGQLNVESLSELERMGRLTKKMKTSIGIGLRINPNVNPDTHPYIATGFRENKFGLDLGQMPAAIEILRAYPGLNFLGLSLHIGSQIFDFKALEEAIEKTLEQELKLKNIGFSCKKLDIGGGVGIRYNENAEDSDPLVLDKFCEVLKKKLGRYPGEIMLEPGRFLVARSGVLLTEVQYIKKTPYKNFLIVSSGMNHFLRPALYQAEHRILPVLQRQGDAEVYDIVGPVCESSDVLGRKRDLIGVREGDWLAIADAGAYGFVMASHYNNFELPQELII